MFTWICPKCGRECPPSYTECPDCSGQGSAKAAEQVSQTPPTAQPPVAPAPAPAPVTGPAPAAVRAPVAAVAAVRRGSPGLPTWLLGIVFAFAFFGAAMAAYMAYSHFYKPVETAPAAPAAAKAVAASPAVAAHPYLKYVEITGWRLLQNPQKQPEIRFIVVNHSGAEIPDLSATVNLRAHAGTETEPIGQFKFKLPSLGPYDSKDLNARLETKLKVYEFPDWQNLFEEIQITSAPR